MIFLYYLYVYYLCIVICMVFLEMYMMRGKGNGTMHYWHLADCCQGPPEVSSACKLTDVNRTQGSVHLIN